MRDTLHVRYVGEGSPLFWLYMKTALLTVLTLGIYRFWAKSRIRRYVWSAAHAGEDAFEYTGTGLEKFLGFLIAIVILAIYLGFVQMILFYFGITLFREPTTRGEMLAQMAGIYITIFATVPLLFFAQYRARRYRMARTRWRGVRFGMESAAWGYVWRAIGHTLLSIVTLGILIPRQTFYLEKYMADRTWYGDAQLRQGGKWTALYPGMKHILFAVLVLVGLQGAGILLQSPALMIIGAIVGYIWLAIGIVHYRVYSFNYLTRNKNLEGAVTFSADASTERVVKIYVLGTLSIIGISLAFGIVLSLFGGALTGGMGLLMSSDFGVIAPGMAILLGILAFVLYVGWLLALGALAMVLILQKTIAHYVNSVTIHGATYLDSVKQRVGDAGADAEGFADALDVGGAI